MTKEELIRAVALKAGLSVLAASRVVDTVMTSMVADSKAGESNDLIDLGSFTAEQDETRSREPIHTYH